MSADDVEIRRVGVLGCGLMGSGIAQVVAAAGYETIVREVDDERLAKGMAKIEGFLAQGVERGKVTASAKSETLARIVATTRLEDVRDTELVIEAVVESLEEKVSLFVALDEILSPSAIRCSNTSSLSVTAIASGSRHPQQFVGLHFFNPVALMAVVEVIPALTTRPELIATSVAFTKSLGKTPVIAPDRPGFIVNRLLVPFLLDAIRALEDGTGTKQDIDAGLKLGCGHPMGPFELLDFVGLDTALHVANIMYDAFKERRFAPPPLLKRMVTAGHLGRKSGRGFYDYG